MTQEFHISVTSIGGDEYLVRTERVETGVPLAEEQVTWPVEDWLTQASVLMNDPLLGLLRGGPVAGGAIAGSDDSLSAGLIRFGQQLYDALFQGTIRDSWMGAHSIAQYRGDILRLRLGLKDQRLPCLPWEVLHAGDRPLAAGTNVVFSRYDSSLFKLANSRPFFKPPTLDTDEPLRILMVLAAPTDQAVLKVRQEAMALQKELQGQIDTQGGQLPDIEITLLDQPGREQLTQALEHGRYQVLHYAGHSDLSAAGGSMYLVSHSTGLTETLNGDDLAGLLANNGVRMAVFNSCRGMYTATTGNNGDGNLAEALVRRGIPAVLAMAERIPDAVALNLSRLFYRNLKRAYPVDLSLNRARQGLISTYGSNQLYWALPILYLHPEFNGYLQPLAGTEPVDRLVASALPVEDEGKAILSHNRSGKKGPVLEARDPFELMDEDYTDDPELIDPLYDRTPNPIIEIANDLRRPRPNPNSPVSAKDEDLRPTTETPRPQYNKVPLLPNDPAYVTPSIGIETLSPPDTAQDIEVYANLRQMLAEAVKLTPAIAQPLDLIAKEPTNPLAFHQLGVALAQQGYFNEALVAQAKAIGLDPRLAEAHNHRGELLLRQGQIDEAIQSFDQALQVKPGWAIAQENLRLATSKRDMASGLAWTDTQGTGSTLPIGHRRTAGPWWQTPAVKWGSLGLAGIGAVVIGTNALRQITTPVPQPNPSPTSQPDISNADLVKQATEAIARNNSGGARPAIESLLDREALKEAESALAPARQNPRYLDDPTINFLMGRLAWQAAIKPAGGPVQYSFDDARRYFEITSKATNSAEVLNALGFAFYQLNDRDRANKSWLRAIEVLGGSNANSPTLKSREALTAYAGLALSFAGSPTTPDRKAKATQLYQHVIASDPTNFQPDVLAKPGNWMWSEKAIGDWRKLQ